MNVSGARPLPALVCIDWQRGFMHPTHWGTDRSTPLAEDSGRRLLAAWRGRGAPVIHVVHASTEDEIPPHAPAPTRIRSPLHPSDPGYAPIEGFEALGDEPTLVKQVNSGFIGTDLEARLEVHRVTGTPVVLCGLTGNHCVNTTARMAGNMGFVTWVAADAVACFERLDWERQDVVLATGEEVKRLSLSNIHGEFCTVAREDQILELLGVGAEGARAEGVMGGEEGLLGGGQQGVAEAQEGAGVGGHGAPLEAAKTAE